MITLKLIAVVLGAGLVASFISEEFGSELILAIVTCLS